MMKLAKPTYERLWIIADLRKAREMTVMGLRDRAHEVLAKARQEFADFPEGFWEGDDRDRVAISKEIQKTDNLLKDERVRLTT